MAEGHHNVHFVAPKLGLGLVLTLEYTIREAFRKNHFNIDICQYRGGSGGSFVNKKKT